MEEVYVIKVKGALPGITDDNSSTIRDESILGLGILHILFGSVAITMGTLGLVIGSDFGVEIFFGIIFASTGLSSVVVWKRPYRKRYRKLLFLFSTLSLASSLILLIVTIVAVVRHHITYGGPGMVASIRANIVINAILETIVACFSCLTSANSIWKCKLLESFKTVNPVSQKVIVTTNISLGGPNSNVDEETLRHVNPHCVISFQKSEERNAIARRVQEFVQEAQCRTRDGNISSTESVPAEETEMCVDLQNCSNELLDVS